MRRSAIGFLFAIVALPAISGPPALGTTTTTSATAPPLSQRSMIVTSPDFSHPLAADCAHFDTRTGTASPAVSRSQEQQEVPRQGMDILKIRKGEQGGASSK